MPKIISSSTLRNGYNEVSAWCREPCSIASYLVWKKYRLRSRACDEFLRRMREALVNRLYRSGYRSTSYGQLLMPPNSTTFV